VADERNAVRRELRARLLAGAPLEEAIGSVLASERGLRAIVTASSVLDIPLEDAQQLIETHPAYDPELLRRIGPQVTAARLYREERERVGWVGAALFVLVFAVIDELQYGGSWTDFAGNLAIGTVVVGAYTFWRWRRTRRPVELP
jgi:hypothetical protein